MQIPTSLEVKSSIRLQDLFTAPQLEVPVDMVFTDPPHKMWNISGLGNTLRNWIGPFANTNIFVLLSDLSMVNYLKHSPFDFRGFFVLDHSFGIPIGNVPYRRHLLLSHETQGDAKPYKNLGDGMKTIIPIKYRGTVPEVRKHPHQKHVADIVPFVTHYTDEGDTVADPFMGTGTTGVAALKCGRQFIGLDNDSEMMEVAQERLGNTARRTVLM